MSERVRDGAVGAGALCLSVGASLAYLPAGLMVFGAFLLLIGLGAVRAR